MAKAAAKKAQAAQAATKKVYQPILLGVNLVWLLLLVVVWWRRTDDSILLPFGSWIATIALLINFGLQYYAYIGILEQSANNNKTKKKDELVGGQHLDLLGVCLVVQYLALLHTSKWLLVSCVGVPMYAGYALYKSVYYGGSGGGGTSQTAPEINEDDPAYKAKQERRQQRAQRRKQKWG